ncbi:hypothetical protein KQX54_012863 [Cotesia glomerata]|uniref:Uncharacterized protein n=1 Tax=Cotesia glomerata TaxID=32391 RepID=A0AAV7IV75_COTGL|nr:hypothetical protein KQX54_012863 [Cotesia glomerata]
MADQGRSLNDEGLCVLYSLNSSPTPAGSPGDSPSALLCFLFYATIFFFSKVPSPSSPSLLLSSNSPRVLAPRRRRSERVKIKVTP